MEISDLVVVKGMNLECGRHLHTNAIRSQISQVENDGVKLEARTTITLAADHNAPSYSYANARITGHYSRSCSLGTRICSLVSIAALSSSR